MSTEKWPKHRENNRFFPKAICSVCFPGKNAAGSVKPILQRFSLSSVDEDEAYGILAQIYFPASGRQCI